MRVAIFVTGFYRSFDTVKHNINLISQKYNADVYIATWNVSDVRTSKNTILPTPITNHNFLDVNNLKACSIYDLENYRQNRISFIQNTRDNDVMVTDPRAIQHGEYWANRLKDQWYLVGEGFKSILSDYDVIFRTRLDIEYLNLELYETDKLVLPVDESNVWDFSDHLAFGGKKAMEKYCLFYNYMQDVYDKHNVDPTHATDFLKFYISKYDQPLEHIADNKIHYRIV
jgi:hypothetical protein